MEEYRDHNKGMDLEIWELGNLEIDFLVEYSLWDWDILNIDDLLYAVRR